jgi:cyclopropane fatty-acyl-phospholipid synthase-like methyltransferase
MMEANAAIQSMLGKNFKTGEVFQTFGGTQFTQIPCYGESKQLISLFSNRCDKKKQEKINEGTILEVGCGYGYTLTSWAEFYDKARIVGIDIDAFAIEYTEKLISQRKWDDRIEVSTIQIEKFAPSNENKFDLILLMQVLHEMNHEGEYRNNVFDNIYKMLKDDGVFIVKEHMIPDLFQPKPNRTVFFDVWHEYFEIAFNVSFYSEQSFREFIETTPFKYAKFIQERSNYFWVLAKKKEILELFK